MSKSSTVLRPCRVVNSYTSFEGEYCSYLQKIMRFLDYENLKMQAAPYSGKLVRFNRVAF